MTEQTGPSAPARGLTLVLGGARSGKSSFAEALAARAQSVLYVATAAIGDEEMRRRVEQHRRRRPQSWRTLEVQRDVAMRAAEARLSDELVLVEDLTLLASNYLIGEEGEPQPESPEAEAIELRLNQEVDRLCELAGPLIVVSNEVGMGLVPPYPLGRLFRDLLGRLNQRVAARADRVYLLVAGVPLTLKGQ